MVKFNCLHILPQESYNSPAFIVGNREGLTDLLYSLIALLLKESNFDSSVLELNVAQNDGEGYILYLMRDKFMSDVPNYYTDKDMCQTGDWQDTKWAIDLKDKINSIKIINKFEQI